MEWPENPVLVEVWRSGFLESAHRGSLVVLDADGAVTFAAGVVDRPILPRSSNKPVQATALLAAGWTPRSRAELAIGAGSHNGEDAHRDLVAAMLDDVISSCLSVEPLWSVWDSGTSDDLLKSVAKGVRRVPIALAAMLRPDGGYPAAPPGLRTAILQEREGLAAIIGLVREALSQPLRETAYAIALDIALAEAPVLPEENRILQRLRESFELDRLTAAALEKAALVRHTRGAVKQRTCIGKMSAGEDSLGPVNHERRSRPWKRRCLMQLDSSP